MQKYLKKKIKDERGVYIAVYAKDPEELERKVAERTAEIEHRKQLAENPLVWQYAQTWYKLYTPRLSDSRKSDYAIAINRHICPIIGARHMLDVTPGDIADVMLACADLSRSSQDKIVCALKKIFAAGEKAGVVRVNPCVDLRAGGKRAAEKEALTRQQMRTLEDAVVGTRIYPFVMIGLYAGLRREEILGLQWDCVHLDGIDDAAAPPRPAGRQLGGLLCCLHVGAAAGVGKVGVGRVDRQRAVVRPRQAAVGFGGLAVVQLLIGIRAAAQPLAQQRQRGLAVTHLYRLPRHSPHCFASSRRTYGGHSRLPEIHPCSVRSGIANRAAKSVCDRPVCCTISLTDRCA